MAERTHVDARYNGRKWRSLREAVLKKNPTCVECGRLATVVDHILPVRCGGGFYDLDNLQPLCADDHNRKSARERKLPSQPEAQKG